MRNFITGLLFTFAILSSNAMLAAEHEKAEIKKMPCPCPKMMEQTEDIKKACPCPMGENCPRKKCPMWKNMKK